MFMLRGGRVFLGVMGILGLLVLSGCNQGNLHVTLSPQAAVDAGAHWAVDGGDWQASGATVGKLKAGDHVVSFKAVDGWATPADSTVTVANQQTAEVTGTYTATARPVPNVAGMTQAAAVVALDSSGLILGTVTGQCSDTVPSGGIQSQNPVAGVDAGSGSAVNVVVSIGPCNVTVPDVSGQTQAAATDALMSAGLVAGAVAGQCSFAVASGSVIAQTPAAGATAASGSAVDLKVSTGPCMVNVPNVVGQTQAAATAAIDGAGLVPGTVTQQCSATTAPDAVISQTPAANSSAPSGSTVNLIVSTGLCNATVPNVAGQTQAAAATVILDAGFAVGTVTRQCSATVAADSVISQFPASGGDATLGSAVNLVVSTGACNATVPNIVGQTQAEAGDGITGAGLVVGAVTQQCSNTVASGSVISQTPAANASATSGSTVSLVVSTGPCNVTVPNVAGQTQAAATTAITGLGLVLGAVTQQCSDTMASGSVISQSPNAGASALESSAVDLVVSTGPCGVTVPDVTGQTQAVAATTLTDAGLTPGTVTQQCSFTVAAGKVISQIPTANSVVLLGSAVDLVVSTGPCNATVPDVVGQTQVAATAAISGVGLVPGTVTQQCSATVASGNVISQTPAANASVPSGSAVDIVVSTGPCDVMVPDVAGQTQAAAATTITGVGLVLGTVTQQCSPTAALGSVISQTPLSGVSASTGSAVNLVVSTGVCNVTVPDIVGQAQAAATLAVTGAGLVIGNITQQCSNTVPSGSVVSQTPAANASASSGSAVGFVVSTGPCNVTVPEVVGQTQAAATAAISGAGLVPGTVSQQCSFTVAQGNVISQTPAAGASTPSGGTVDFVMSTGPCNVFVPNVVGQTQADAANAISGGGLVLGTVTQSCDAAVPAGEVISQTPAANSQAPSGSAVNLVLSTGLCGVTVPNVVGQTQAAATTAIMGAALVLGAVTQQCDPMVALGSVISQTPAADTPASAGGAVNLVVSTGPCTVTVPDVAGLTQSAASSAIISAGLVVGTVTQQCSNIVADGRVISQTPDGNGSASAGSAVDLVVSTGPCNVTVPNVAGQTQPDATIAITGAGLAAGAVSSECSDTVPAGNVIRQTPEAGGSVPSGTAVDLVISTGPCTVTVPAVAGLSQSAATSAITDAGLAVGTITWACSNSAEQGTVIGEAPASGFSASPGSSVDLLVASGPCTVPVPDLSGMTQAEAAAAISAAGLIPGTATEECSDAVPVGQVAYQMPLKDTQVAPGSTVEFRISVGVCMAIVPDVVNETQADAAYYLPMAWLPVGTVTQQCSDTVTAGNVISQSSVAGSSIPLGTPVDLVVSTGTCRVTVPNVVSQTQDAATTSITGAGLTVGAVLQACSNTVAAGKVLWQAPAANALVTAGATINLSVSSGPCAEIACANTVLVDGGFESGTPNKFWAETDANGGAPLTSVTGTGKTPHSGSWWAYFGSSTKADTASVSQTRTIPAAASATLTFYLRISAAGTATGTLTASIDKNELARFTNKNAAQFGSYVQVVLDVSGYADGLSHALSIAAGTSAASLSNHVSFSVDDVCLSTSNTPYSYPLTVSRTGTGNGTVTGTSIDCGGDCAGLYTNLSQITLTATPDANSTFAGWTGVDDEQDTVAYVTMDRAKTVTAGFAPKNRSLNIAVSAPGGAAGSVLGPNNTSCNSSCQYPYLSGTRVVLSANPAYGSKFTGWTGADTTDGQTCTVTLMADKTVTANFAPDTHVLTVTKSGTGFGAVTSDKGGINCIGLCPTADSTPIAAGATVTLTAAADPTSTFTGWTGADTTDGNTCTVVMGADKTVHAIFTINTYALTAAKTGNGRVISNDGKINCGDDCTQTYDAQTVVNLTATPALGYVFSSWTNADLTSGNTCQAVVNGDRTVTANFTAQNYTLNVSKDGNGTGTVTSGGPEINCGGDCTESYPAGTIVTLTAVEVSGSSFSAWTGADWANGLICTVTMNSDKNVKATFVLPNYALTVSRGGNGNGTVTANGINCPGDCTESYASGTAVSLTATAAPDSTFAGWSGDASGNTTPYPLTMDEAKNVTATFTLKTYTLDINKNGNGTVTSNTGGINCGGTCSAAFNAGTPVQLTANPASGYAFTGWGGDAAGTANPVTVTMNAAKTVTANFVPSYLLTISKSGNGLVVSDTGGINCGSACSASYASGAVVTLTATPDSGYTLDHWTGADSVSGTSCTVTMNAARNVSATFAASTGQFKIVNSSQFWIVSIVLNGTQQLPSGQGLKCGTGTQTYTLPSGSATYHVGLGTTAGEIIYYENSATVPAGQTYTLTVGAEQTFQYMLANGSDWWSYHGSEYCGALDQFRLIIHSNGQWDLHMWTGAAWNNTCSGTLSATMPNCILDPFVFKFNDASGQLVDVTGSYPQISPYGSTLTVEYYLPACNPAVSLLSFFKDATRKPVTTQYPPP